jgi:nucleoside-diphosphate kinase
MKHLVTLALIKPDLVKRYRVSGGGVDALSSRPLPPGAQIQYLPTVEWKDIETRIEACGLRILARKSISRWSRREVEAFYATHRGRFFYPRLVHYMTTGPLEALLLTHVTPGVDPTAIWRALIGPTHVAVARTLPHTLRALYALSDTKNSFHGSDSLQTAQHELRFFFPDFASLESEQLTAVSSSTSPSLSSSSSSSSSSSTSE